MIEIWEDKRREAPSVQVGNVVVELGKKETQAQSKLFELVANHPDTDAGATMRGPVTDEIGDAFVAVLHEEVAKFRPKLTKKKKMGHFVDISVDKS